MTGSPYIKTDIPLRQDFASSADNDTRKPGRRKRMAPLSIRLSPEERARLEVMAGNQPIGRFVKGRLFAANDNNPAKARKHSAVQDQQSLARILGMLARMEVFHTLKALLSEASRTPLKPETEYALREACRDIAEIRRMLIKALGIKAE